MPPPFAMIDMLPTRHYCCRHPFSYIFFAAILIVGWPHDTPLLPDITPRHSATPCRRHAASFFARPDFFIMTLFALFSISIHADYFRLCTAILLSASHALTFSPPVLLSLARQTLLLLSAIFSPADSFYFHFRRFHAIFRYADAAITLLSFLRFRFFAMLPA
jgi:hypothetical protein